MWSVILSPHSIAARVWRDDLLAQWGSPLFLLKTAQLLHPRGDKEQVEENGTLSGHCPYVGSCRGSIKKEKTPVYMHATSLLLSLPQRAFNLLGGWKKELMKLLSPSVAFLSPLLSCH